MSSSRTPPAADRFPTPRIGALAAGLVSALVAGACSLFGGERAPIATVASVDLQRYMGPWFIIASIPLDLEKGAHDGVETYTLNPDGSIATVFQFRKDAFNGELKTIVGTSYVEEDTGNAVWGVRIVWPFKGEYRIAWLASDYSAAIVARSARDHVWVLGRKAIWSDAELAACRQRIAAMGYDMSKFQRLPQDGAKPS